MKRFSLLIALLGLFTLISADQLTAADSFRSHQPPRHGKLGYGYEGHQRYGSAFSGVRQYSALGHPLPLAYSGGVGHISPRYVASRYGHGIVRRGHGNQGYRTKGHRGGLQISTPSFGLRIGH